MLKNYFKVALRNLIKNRSHTAINVGGLTLGVVCALVIFLVIQFDLSFDTFHKDGDRIYRIVKLDREYGGEDYGRGGPYPLAEAVRTDITGVEFATLVNNNSSNTPILSYTDENGIEKKFKEENFVFVDPDYFNIFSYNWVLGNPESALSRPNTVVVTTSFANKMFGSENVLGKNIVYRTSYTADLEITGVIEDLPDNSDFPFTVIAVNGSKNRQGESYESDSWSSSSTSQQTYVKLLPGVNAYDVNAQFDELITKYRDEEVAAYLDYFLQPLSEIHFDSRFGNYNGRTIEKSTLFALGVIGLFLLITACINFINLNTAIAVNRSKEVGLRKTLGGTRIQLTFHFLGETAFVTIISILLGLAVTELVLRGIEPILGFIPELSLLGNPQLLLFLGSLFFAITIAAGFYPAQFLSSLNPIQAIRNKVNASYGRGLILRRSLIIVQFGITQVLVICTVIIATQIQYFQSVDMGFESEAVIEVPIPSNDVTTLNTFRNLLTTQSSISNVSYSNTGTANGSVWGGNFWFSEDSVQIEDNAQIKFVDEYFVDTYGVTLLGGNNLAPSDTVREYLVNEAFTKKIGYGENPEELIGKEIMFWGEQAPIVGIVKNFNTQSLHNQVSPVVITTSRQYYQGAIKINLGNTSGALAAIEKAYVSTFPDYIFEYEFLDENIAEMYDDEQRTARIMNAFTLIAILIGSLGLFGLVSYMATTRTKEIGVRKVLGANILDILKIFGFELALLIGISFVIAAPISWYLMQKWLADFAYKIELGAGIFIFSLAGTILIAVLTVGYRTITAALANPVESLKSE